MSRTIYSELPALRRYGALLLGSKERADDHIEERLSDAVSSVDVDDLDPYELFHSGPLPGSELKPEDFSRADHHLLRTLHKLAVDDRARLLLAVTANLEIAHIGSIFSETVQTAAARLARARMLMEASHRNRLCMIVEDDVIAMRHLQAELTEEHVGIAGTAKNRTDAFGLVDRLQPDIALIDLALPEGATAGADIAERLRRRFATKIIFVTAFAKIAKELATPSDMIVPKPWSAGSLKHAISVATA